ncbi:hypothetical protein M0802_012712 [Mischocyttarus mexicanus]|nr:hypothetical protein M0802_012712 [Mischocyttarus mexicanus]
MLFQIVSNIMVPDIWYELEKLEKELEKEDTQKGDRSLIITDTMNRYTKSHQDLQWISCVMSYLEDHSNYSTIFLMSNSSFEDNYVNTDLLVHIFQAEIAMYTLNNNKNLNKSKEVSSVIVVIENLEDLERKNCSNYLKICAYELCNFVIISSKMFENEDNFLEEADNIQQFLWLEQVSKIVILGSTRDTVLLAATRSFKPDELCTPSAPIILSKCQGKIWNGENDIDDDFQMNGCSLVVGYNDNPFYSFVNNETDDENILGLEGFIVKEILSNINGRLIREMIPLTGNMSIDDDFKMITQRAGQRIDLLLGGHLWNPDDNKDNTIAYEMIPLVWMLPNKANVSLRGLIAPFGTIVWLVTLGLLLLGILVKCFFIKNISFLDISALLLGVSVYRQPEETSSRILFLSWALFSFFMSQYYLASLSEQLINVSNLQIETMKELVSSGIELGAITRYAELFDEDEENEYEYDDDDDETKEINRNIRKKITEFSFNDYVKQCTDLFEGKNTSMALIVKLNVSNHQLNLIENVNVLDENMGTHPVAIVTWRGFPCLKRINIKMQQLIESGIIKHWTKFIAMNGSYFYLHDEIDSDNNINLESVVPSFLLLIIGYLIALLSFFIELIVHPNRFLESC